MSPADSIAPPAPIDSVRRAWPPQALLSGWGRTAPTRARVLRPYTAEQVAGVLAEAGAAPGGLIARGAGRSYGDAAQNGGGTVLDATALAGTPALDAARGVVTAGAGTTFAQLLVYLAARGLTLPVVPGTRHLTVGGAIASDVHGKNHPRDGSVGRQLASFTLCTPADGPIEVSPESERDLFEATVGGMGLTGVITEATLRVTALGAPRADIDRVKDIEQALALMAGEGPHRYAIAWVDLLCGGSAFGRAVVTRSEMGPPDEAGRGGRRTASASGGAQAGWSARLAGGAGQGAPFPLRPRARVPRGFPAGVLRPATVRAFNALHWRSAPRQGRGRQMTMSANLFPLDVLGDWNRLYGPGGLLQYQFVVPRGAEDVLLRTVHLLRTRRQPMYLAVLKRFGPGSGGLLSFPLEGWTFAIDIPADAPGLGTALDEADELVAAAGGRVYLAKDSRLRSDTLAAMYPDLGRFRELRERVDPRGTLRSDMARRLGLCE
jgi:decaprenylphospho-beta-D-ribofuranose 2-oxidase